MSEQHITTPKRLVHNTIFNCVTLVSSAAIAFFLIRFFLAQLGEIRYGVWVLIGSVFQYRRLLDMGMNSSIDRYIPMNLARGDDNAIQRVVSTSLFFFAALAVVLGLLTLLLYDNIGAWFAIAPDMAGSAGVLALVVGFSFALAMPLQVSAALLCGLQRYDVLNITELLMLLLRTILVVVLLQQGYGLLTLGLVFGGSEVLLKIVQFIFARKLLPNVSITLKSIDFKLLREMLAYGVNTCLYTMGGLLILKAAEPVIAIFIGTAEVSQFAVAAAGILLLSQVLRAFTTAIKPAVSDLDARQEHSHVREISLLMQKYSLLLIVPAACFFVVMGKEFLYVWVGEKFQDPNVVNSMGVILAVLTVGHGLRLAQYSNFLVLVGKGDHRIFGLLTVLMGLLSVSASVVCVKVFHLGLLAIAWANCVPMVLISGIILPIYFNAKMRISMRESAVRIWWPALLGCMPAIIVICSWKYFHSPASWFSVAMVALVSAGLTGISAWRFSLTPRERERLLKTLVLRRARHSSAPARRLQDCASCVMRK
ncbi:MAG TPA: lipopolysaccharide biosynthesis protein [Sedimentisphaerales bacterium]|nr:lipopolysaccharide biosynthesis protein [Sedimentisphaerales bacterium]